MEMDEIISQIQQWRCMHNGTAHNTDLDDTETNAEWAGSTYQSEAYDRLFKSHGGPESDVTLPLQAEKKYTADDEMIAKVREFCLLIFTMTLRLPAQLCILLLQLVSLQALIQESKSSASVASHQKHVLEFQALMKTLQERYVGKLDTNTAEDISDSDSDSGDGDVYYTTKEPSNTKSNNNYEDSQADCSSKAIVSPRNRPNYTSGRLETQFKTIDVEVRGTNFELSRQQENEVIFLYFGCSMNSQVFIFYTYYS